MEIKYLCEEWFEKNKFDCNVSSVRDAMLSIDSKLKEVEACCIKAGLGSIGYQDKTDLIEEWYDIQNRLVKAVDGIGSYIIDEIDKPFAENIAYIYDKAKAMSLDNYTTKNIFHNSKTSGVEGLSTFHEKEKITLHDLMGMAQLDAVQTDNNFLDKATGIYRQQYITYRESNKNVTFDDFIAQTFGIQNDKMTHVNKNKLLGMIGGFANHWEPHNLIQALSEIYEEEKEKNGSFFAAAVLRATNIRKIPTSGKIKTTTVRVTSPKLKGSQMAECAVYVLKQRNSINGILSEVVKKAMEALVKARKNLEGTGNLVTAQQLKDFGWTDTSDEFVERLNKGFIRYGITDKNSIAFFMATMAEESGWGKSSYEDRLDFSKVSYTSNDRGAGYIQITHRETHLAFLKSMGDDFSGVDTATYISENYALESALWYWSSEKAKSTGVGSLNDYVETYGSGKGVFLVTQYYVNSWPKGNNTNTNLAYIRNGGSFDDSSGRLNVNGESYPLPTNWDNRSSSYDKAINVWGE